MHRSGDYGLGKVVGRISHIYPLRRGGFSGCEGKVEKLLV
jgi:hypothetical protein